LAGRIEDSQLRSSSLKLKVSPWYPEATAISGLLISMVRKLLLTTAAHSKRFNSSFDEGYSICTLVCVMGESVINILFSSIIGIILTSAGEKTRYLPKDKHESELSTHVTSDRQAKDDAAGSCQGEDHQSYADIAGIELREF
jgi:hypothetical protein